MLPLASISYLIEDCVESDCLEGCPPALSKFFSFSTHLPIVIYSLYVCSFCFAYVFMFDICMHKIFYLLVSFLLVGACDLKAQ